MIEKICYLAMTLSAIALAVASLSSRTSNAGSSSPTAIERGEHVPDLTLITAEGDSVSGLSSRPTLVTFFSTSCVYCRASLPIYRKIAAERCDLTMSFVAYDREGEDSGWWEQNAWESSASCADVRVGSAGSSLASFDIKGTPTHLWIGPDGALLHAESGALTAMPAWLDQRHSG